VVAVQVPTEAPRAQVADLMVQVVDLMVGQVGILSVNGAEDFLKGLRAAIRVAVTEEVSPVGGVMEVEVETEPKTERC